MDLDPFLLATFCLVDDIMDDILGHKRLRQRGPAPTLADREVITLEIVGEYLSLHQDKAIFTYCRRPYAHFFPALGQGHRPTCVRQAAHLCHMKERVWPHRLPQVGCDPSRHVVDRFPLPVGQCARAYRCQRFRGEGTFGYDTRLRPTCYGFRVQVLVAWPGVIVRFSWAPAHIHEIAVVPELVHGRPGTVVGDRNYGSPRLQEELAWQSLHLRAPFQKAQHDPGPRRSAHLSRFRYRIDTVVWSTRGPLPHPAGVGPGPVASESSAPPPSAQPHYRLYAQSGSGASSPADLQVGQLNKNLHTGLK